GSVGEAGPRRGARGPPVAERRLPARPRRRGDLAAPHLAPGRRLPDPRRRRPHHRPHPAGGGVGGPAMTTSPATIAAAAAQLGDLAQQEVPLGPRTTYRVGGPAALFVEVGSDDDLARVAAAVQA